MQGQTPDTLPARLRIVCIGDELLSGLRRDSNSHELLTLLAPLGLKVAEIRLVPDEPAVIRALAEEPGWFTIGTGGLGPTVDDRSRQALAEAFEARLEHDAGHRARFQARLAAMGRDPRAAHPGQSLHPVPGASFPNPVGSADGLLYYKDDRVWLALPGVPSEMRALMHEEVLPWLRSRIVPAERPPACYARVWSLPEQEVARRLEPLADFTDCEDPGFYPGTEGVLVRLQVRDGAPARSADAARTLLLQRLDGYVIHEGPEDLATLLLAELRRRGQTLAVAESCTGGLLAGALTRLPGSSEVFQGGMVTYSNALKQAWLGVDTRLLEEHGAVSGPCVMAMAREVRQRSGADWALAVSGIAGPGGGTPDKPVGTVWLGLSGAEGDTARHFRMGGNRDQVRARAVGQSLAWLYRRLVLGVSEG
jgi:nicotinamide-nucleotide amidase